MAISQEDGSCEPVNVLDLPQLHTKPTNDEISRALASLKVKPLSWNASQNEQFQIVENRTAVASYLTKIVASGLTWISNEEHRVELWETASRRLSERAGRFGMAAMTRTFTIYQTPTCDEISLSIHEPSLTEDNVGLKTWGSAYLLAQRLDSIGVEFLGLNANYRNERDFPLVLELGSGTGLVGLAAAAVWKCKVILTDLPEIIPNLQSNIACNKKMIIRLGGCVEAHELDWNSPPDPQSHHSLCPVEVILAADPLYSPNHAPILVNTVSKYLARSRTSRVIIELPLRDNATKAMGDNLRDLMIQHGFELLHQGEESGFDDWEENGERAVLSCWWGIWRRQAAVNASEELECPL